MTTSGKEIADAALKSPYAVVRYLASKIAGNQHEKRVRNDSHALVSSSNMISGCAYFSRVCEDITSFLALSQSERIEQLSYCSSSGGEFFDIISLAREELQSSDILELLLAYLTNPYVKRDVERRDYKAHMGMNWYSDSKERDSLWKLLTLFPEGIH